MPRKKFALVFNNRAGIARPKLLDGVLAGLKAGGAHVFPLPARSAEEASQRVGELAQLGGADAVIAAGGDGTFRAVAIGAAGTALPVGFIPLGTGNVLAYEIGVKKRAADLTRVLLSGDVIPVQGGLVNGVPFFLMVGAGYDARIVNGLNYKTKRLLARAAYTAPVLKTLAHGAERFDVDVDGRRFEASWVIVTRASHYGGSFTLTRATQMGADPMIAIVIDARSRLALLNASTALGLGRLGDPKTCPRGVTVLPAQRVQIGRINSVPVQVDGDESDSSPADVVAN
ncbi:MAG: diacylglycerol kinase, partial [Hyphomicrobiaceae bacterium]|nr:diacylglycerol kinase [Hyphomicrobiaceae bacterium]